MILRMWNFCKVWVLSGYTQTHSIKGIPEISHPKTPYYFSDNSTVLLLALPKYFHTSVRGCGSLRVCYLKDKITDPYSKTFLDRFLKKGMERELKTLFQNGTTVDPCN